MSLTEYQKRFIEAAQGSGGLELGIEYFEANPKTAQLIVPVSAEAAAQRHVIGGAIHARDVLELLVAGGVDEAQVYVDELRRKAEGRGVEKDALPMLIACGVIESPFEGDVVVPDEESLQAGLEELDNVQQEVHQVYREIQFGYE